MPNIGDIPIFVITGWSFGPPSSLAFTLSGDVTGSSSATTVIAWRGKSLEAASMGAPADAQIPIYDSATSTWRSISLSGGATIDHNGVVTVSGGGGYPGTGAAALSFSSPSGALNLSTLGTRDWFAPGGISSQNYRVSLGTAHSKILGGFVLVSFDWVSTTGWTAFTQASVYTLTTTATDDVANAPLSGASTDQGYDTSSILSVNVGYRLRVPADTYARTLTLYGSFFSCAATLTATPTDGSFATLTDTRDAGAAGTISYKWVITYNTARDGQELEVSVVVTTNHGSSPNFKFTAATLS